MTTNKIELSADTVLVKLFGGVTGITRRAEDKGTQQDGKAIETKNLITTRQADAQEAEKARKLLNKLRGIVDSYTTTVLNLSIAPAGELPKLREEIAPVQQQIEEHNASAKYHKVDRALIMAPIALKADPAALAEICRSVADELKTARSFFTFQPPAVEGDAPVMPLGAESLDEWKVSVDNWIKRTKGLGSLFPTVTGQCIAEGIESVKSLRDRVFKLARAKEGASQSPATAIRGAITEVATPEALGLIDSAIGLTVIVDADAKAKSDAMREAGITTELH